LDEEEERLYRNCSRQQAVEYARKAKEPLTAEKIASIESAARDETEALRRILPFVKARNITVEGLVACSTLLDDRYDSDAEFLDAFLCEVHRRSAHGSVWLWKSLRPKSKTKLYVFREEMVRLHERGGMISAEDLGKALQRYRDHAEHGEIEGSMPAHLKRLLEALDGQEVPA
jgi:hypothetical protein